MARGQVRDEIGRRVDTGTAFRVGACIFYYRELENEKIIPFRERVLYQDEHILVAEKPHFLPVIPSGKFLNETLLVRLRKRLAMHDLVPIHRLDRETAGVVLFSLNRKTRGHYTALFRNRRVRKVYVSRNNPTAPSRAEVRLFQTWRRRLIYCNNPSITKNNTPEPHTVTD